MIAVTAAYEDQTGRLARLIHRKSTAALRRGAAYLRGVAVRKIRRRKGVSSKPGEPPIAHSGAFKASVLWAMDSPTTAVVGPQMFGEFRTNRAGQPIPNILEFGGMAALGQNANWYHKRAPNLKTRADMATYFAGLGKGPGYWGTTRAQAYRRSGISTAGVRRKSSGDIAHGGKRSQYVAYKRYSPVLQRKVYIVNINVKSPKAANKVAGVVEELFGYPVTNKAVHIAARPLMAPALAAAKPKIATFFENLT